MHVSSTFRIEASKLFWADPNAFYLVDGDWIHEGGYPGSTYCDFSFMANVQNVIIDPANCIRSLTSRDGRWVDLTDAKTGFKELTRILPNAKKLVIKQNWNLHVTKSDMEPVLHIARNLRQFFPQLDVAALVIERLHNPRTTVYMGPATHHYQRALYRLSADGSWREATDKWNSATLLIPSKKFQGPAGEFYGPEHKRLQNMYKHHSFWPLMIEALDRHHFDNGRNTPFKCPDVDCDAYFTQAGQWSLHAMDFHTQG